MTLASGSRKVVFVLWRTDDARMVAFLPTTDERANLLNRRAGVGDETRAHSLDRYRGRALGLGRSGSDSGVGFDLS